MCNLKKKSYNTLNSNSLIQRIEVGDGMVKMGEGGQKIHTSSYKKNKSWGYKVIVT